MQQQDLEPPTAHRHAARTVKVNFGCGKDIRPAEDGWVNVDGFMDHPGVVKHDIIDTPWSFLKDDSVDVLYTSHVLEHIPLVYRKKTPTSPLRDVLFDIMEEAHRVVKPGGVWDIKIPPGMTLACWPHPQHYRNWHEVSFVYWNHNRVDETWLHTAAFDVVSTRRQHHPDPVRNLPHLYNWKVRGIPVMEHLRIRTRWVEKLIPGWWKMFCIKGELHVVLRKVANHP